MLVLDVETSWSQDTDAIDAQFPPVPDAATLEPPKSYKNEDTIAAWRVTRHAELVEKRAEDVKEAWASTSLDALQGGVLCVGIAVDDRDPVVVWEATEEATLTKLQAGLAAYPDHALVGWNCLTFDFPYIARRALRYKLWDLAARLYHPKPWSTREHVDLYSVWCAADRRSKGRLMDVARHLGIEVKGTIAGAHVPELWWHSQGTMAEGLARQQIADHVIEDVRITREVGRIFERAGWLARAA
jgi:uncharacterized protein YprB with RNaseH-like and TPR domain